MIIAQLTGDLGNQMFQYALGRRLALIHQTPLKLDITDFETSPHHYKLDRFRIRASIAAKKDVSQLINLHLLRHADSAVSPDLFAAQTNIEENPYLVTVRDNTYLTGDCWMLRYFSTISDNLRNELRVKTPPEGLNKKYLRQIVKESAVSIHLYRNSSGNDGPASLSMDYYYRAIEHIANQVKRPVFYLFSDDPAWCKTNFIINYPIRYIDHNDYANLFEDFRLMKNCKHHIIANTAMSWWAAWLSLNKKKIVIAPEKYFDNDQVSDDLLPQRWIRLKN